MTGPGYAFRDLPEQAFPFWIVTYDVDTKTPLFWAHVEGPGAIYVPGKPEGVQEVGVFMRFGDGSEIDR